MHRFGQDKKITDYAFGTIPSVNFLPYQSCHVFATTKSNQQHRELIMCIYSDSRKVQFDQHTGSV